MDTEFLISLLVPDQSLKPKESFTIESLRLACEFGFKQAEKGHNLQMALIEFNKVMED